MEKAKQLVDMLEELPMWRAKRGSPDHDGVLE
jgi:hypothetical protein